jgi:spore germination protein GerM
MRTRSRFPARRPRLRIPLAAALALVLVVAGLLAACGEDEEPGTSEAATAAPQDSAASTVDAAQSTADAATSEPASPSESEATAPETTPTPSVSQGDATTEASAERPVAIYLVRNERVSPVRRYVDPAAPAKPTLEALLAGPTADDGDRTTAIPEGTRLLGVSIDGDGVLTADLTEEFTSGGGSLSMKLRAAQVVYTATQFPTVTAVRFSVNGEPLETLGGEGLIVDQPQTRADYEDETPAVLIEEPLPGDAVPCPVRARGTSNVFEATSLMALAPPGELTTMPTDPTVVTATSGTGTRGTFDVEVPCAAGTETGEQSLVSWWDSAKDGSPQGVETIPIQLVP